MTFSEIINRWPSHQDLATDLGVSREAVRKWRERDWIPPLHWMAVEEAAARRGIAGVTARLMSEIPKPVAA